MSGRRYIIIRKSPGKFLLLIPVPPLLLPSRIIVVVLLFLPSSPLVQAMILFSSFFASGTGYGPVFFAVYISQCFVRFAGKLKTEIRLHLFP
jgi:hypothetical protein